MRVSQSWSFLYLSTILIPPLALGCSNKSTPAVGSNPALASSSLGPNSAVKDARNSDGWTDDNEVWRQTDSGPRQLTRDGIPKRLPVLAANGKQVVYIVDHRLPDVPRKEGDGGEEDVVETDGNGNVLRHIIPDGYIPRQFDRLEWIENQRIGVMACGHANCFYWIFEADTGKTLKVMEGGFDFIWSHDGRWVAR